VGREEFSFNIKRKRNCQHFLEKHTIGLRGTPHLSKKEKKGDVPYTREESGSNLKERGLFISFLSLKRGEKKKKRGRFLS